MDRVNERCPVCGKKTWVVDYDRIADGEMCVSRCETCGWPPPSPHRVDEWREKWLRETELEDVQDELADAKRELQSKEEASLDRRVVDEDRYQISLLRLRQKVRSLEAEERRLIAAECPCDGEEGCVC